MFIPWDAGLIIYQLITRRKQYKGKRLAPPQEKQPPVGPGGHSLRVIEAIRGFIVVSPYAASGSHPFTFSGSAASIGLNFFDPKRVVRQPTVDEAASHMRQPTVHGKR
jgi:hypothetical protein